MRGEVFERGDEIFFTSKFSVALKSIHRGDAKLGVEKRVFTVSLLNAAPAWIACHVHHRRECLMRAAHARLLGRHGVKGLDECGIKRAAERDGLRKPGGADGRVTMQTFLVKNYRDAEPRVPDEKFLDGVGQLRRGARRLADACVRRLAARVAGASDLSDAIPMFERGLRFREIKTTVRIHELR